MEDRVIKGSRAFAALLAVGGLALSGGAAYILTLPDLSLKGQIAGWVGVPFFFAAAIGCVIQAIRPITLTLTPRGFSYTRYWRKPLTIAWADVEPFFIYQVRRTKIVSYRFLEGRRPKGLQGGLNRAFGLDGSLPTTLTIRGQALADLLNDYRSQALAAAAGGAARVGANPPAA
jgi:hypothetical protein